MPRHAEKRVLSQTPKQLFDLVSDIERYPDFLPWCIAARITSKEGSVICADLVVGFSAFREKFSSRVTLDDGSNDTSPRIDVDYLEGPMRHMQNHWVFQTHEQGTEIDFMVDFEFKSKIMETMMGKFFSEAAQRMVGAFETRANDLYGTSAPENDPDNNS
ncbi:MAG: type II toxin-antitoxin system RatA family toxin [Rhodospirillales bacterium]|jgi:coenzyme Q-binding protein COQ10|nr:type II toxin-antitoxin system RatA family toxin [Rhodospirillales bacterium]MBT5112763.1 type II toxin-antitoxin system RatA family toxin [Rhodospirillales bacterium]MBT5673533.1 type II toxin-antitoxin system RatA family toxin [Rhodospirillales bacterium]MBT6186192.1 type II toxin-antitoxin system RatA family toxin [Rhodospirillales bacterium]MBT6741983.1 type II toxin-antitoxin system RatA family toxin [Rhodospirillales bacterium]